MGILDPQESTTFPPSLGFWGALVSNHQLQLTFGPRPPIVQLAPWSSWLTREYIYSNFHKPLNADMKAFHDVRNWCDGIKADILTCSLLRRNGLDMR